MTKKLSSVDAALALEMFRLREEALKTVVPSAMARRRRLGHQFGFDIYSNGEEDKRGIGVRIIARTTDFSITVYEKTTEDAS